MTPHEFLAKIRDAGALAPAHHPVQEEHVSQYIIHPADQVVSPDTGEVWLHPQLLRLFDAAREGLGKPLPVSAGSRTIGHELQLQNLGYKTARFLSPHCLSALDIPARTASAREIMAALREAAEKLSVPPPRFGHRAYDEAWVHVDLLPLFFQPYNQTLPHPADWPDLQDDVRRIIDSGWRPGVEW